MRLYVLKPIRLKRAGKLFDVSPGAIVEISKPEKAQTLIASGHVRPFLPDDVGKPFAFRLFLKILGEEVWVVTHPEAIAFVSAVGIYYLPEEIRGLRGATPEEIQAVHRVKRELGGKLITVNQREDKVLV